MSKSIDVLLENIIKEVHIPENHLRGCCTNAKLELASYNVSKILRDFTKQGASLRVMYGEPSSRPISGTNNRFYLVGIFTYNTTKMKKSVTKEFNIATFSLMR